MCDCVCVEECEVDVFVEEFVVCERFGCGGVGGVVGGGG